MINTAKRVYRWLRQRYKLRFHYPQQISLEFTTRCNLRCELCGRTYILDELEMVDMHHLEVVAEELKRIRQPDLVMIVGLGEPLLHKDCDDYLYYLREMFPDSRLSLFTNGVTLHKHIPASLETMDMVTVGVNIAGRQRYKRFTGSDQYNRVVENAKQLLTERNGSSPVVRIQLLNIQQVQDVKEVFFRQFKPCVTPTDKLNTPSLVNFAGLVNLAPYVLPSDALAQPMSRYPCWQVWTNLFFSANGEVYPCCVGTPLLGELCLGNLIETPDLQTILNNGTLDHIKTRMRQGDYHEFPRCHACNVWKRFPNLFR